mmetsp:Transcript_40724/g.83287  ORF Transcript_40724/g.83287 Transcript_40724/m.83287 type:complete len:408 (+) Transcript_40724:144-1367(+)
MYTEIILPDISFLDFQEIPYTSSRLFNNYIFKKSGYLKNFSFVDYGNSGLTGQTFRKIGSVDWINCESSCFFSFIVTTKNVKINEKKIQGDSLELWEHSVRNGLTKISTLLLSNKEEIWNLKWERCKKKKKWGVLILFCGFNIRILEIPRILPKFNIVSKESFIVNLANVFHWKFEGNKNIIITGDLSGKITIFNFRQNFYWKQLNHSHKNFSPIGGIKTLFNNNKKEFRYLISGGYDGIVKIWDLKKTETPIKKFYFPKRWIIDLNFYCPYPGDLLLLVNFDNGFLSFHTFSLDTNPNQIFCNQAGVWGLFFRSNNLITAGKDGFINLIEINSPSLRTKISLRGFFSIFLFLLNNSKPRLANTNLQSEGGKFQNKVICSKILKKREKIIGTFGNSGILIFTKLRVE